MLRVVALRRVLQRGVVRGDVRERAPGLGAARARHGGVAVGRRLLQRQDPPLHQETATRLRTKELCRVHFGAPL